MKLLLRCLIVLLVAAGTYLAVHLSRKGPQASSGGRLTVHFTCDSSGRLEPCGCFTGQHGGLTRLRTWLGEQSPSGAVLKLDAGGAIAGGADYDLIQHRYMARAYATMGFSALNMGRREAAIPAADLVKLSAVSAVPMLSASLVSSETRETLLTPYRIVKIDGLRIGILGVVSPRSVPTPGEGVAVLGLNEAIDRHLPKVAAESDLVILLAFANELEMRRLANDYYELALVLGGDVPGPTQDLIRENESLIAFTTNQARTVGTLSATVTGDARKHLSDPAYQIQLLKETIPQDGELVALAGSYRAEIRKTALDLDDPDSTDPNAIPGVGPSATYVGSTSCRDCHAKDHAVWEKSGHAHAFATLEKKGADADPHCISCHTVGSGKQGGYRRPMGSKSLVDVGCESCHGPGSEHVARYRDGKPTNFKFRPLGAGDCMTCHYGEFSRPFNWEEFWPKIAHGSDKPVIK